MDKMVAVFETIVSSGQNGCYYFVRGFCSEAVGEQESLSQTL
jgi:hypothetical protein